MLPTTTRRSFLAAMAAAGVSATTQKRAMSAPGVSLDEAQIISHLPHRYHGWPTVTRRATGELLLVYSGGREAHVCPFGRVELMRSHDEGETWSWPEVVIDGPIDDRDAGVLETAKGTLLVTTFTSLAYEPILEKAQQSGDWPAEKLERWQAAHGRIDADARQKALGVGMKRSTDGGITWSGLFPCLVDSPHGPIQLRDGRLLYAGKDLYGEGHRVGVCESLDDGATWHWLAEIPAREHDNHDDYHELHAVETESGDLIVQIRNHNEQNARETLQTESTDGGRTWSTPHSIGVWGLPSHLLRLRDNRLLMTYGHRRSPLGNQARVSEDHGRTWSEAIIVSGDGTSGDLGYPSTVQLSDDSLLTVWYERLSDSPYAQIRQRRWRLS